MGAKMTEDLRGIAQFFMKEFPLDVNQRHIKKTKNQTYYQNRFAAILGGICRSTQDILDKILLANSLLDNAKQIILVGELGIAALCSIGIKVGRVERRKTVDQQYRDYAKLQPFFKRLFEKAQQMGVNIVLPQDVVIGPKFIPKGSEESPNGSKLMNESH
jgi:3-phosphoglycerate kinase